MLIVDGHNLAFADDQARNLLLGGRPDAAIQRIGQLVHAYAQATRQQALVVFDGAGGSQPAPAVGRIRYLFSGDKTADLEIMRVIRGSTGRREISLVTSDRSLASSARKSRARTIGVAAFLKEVGRLQRVKRTKTVTEPAGKLTGASPDEVEYWLKVFSDDQVPEAGKERAFARRKKRP